MSVQKNRTKEGQAANGSKKHRILGTAVHRDRTMRQENDTRLREAPDGWDGVRLR